MNNESNSNDLLLEILTSEIEMAILNSEKIQSRFRQISNAGILEKIAHQTFCANLGDLAKAILEGVDIKDSLPNDQQEQISSENNSISESQKLLQQSTDDSASQDKPYQNEITYGEIKEKSHYLNQQIDGRKLSLQEIKFQEYLEEQFNEDTWLAKEKIDYPGL